MIAGGYGAFRRLAPTLCLTDDWRPTGLENLTSFSLSWTLLFWRQPVLCREGLSSLCGRAGGHPPVQLAAAIDEDAGELARGAGTGLCTTRQAATYLRKRRHGWPQWKGTSRPPGIEGVGVFFEVAAPEYAFLIFADCISSLVDWKRPRMGLLRCCVAGPLGHGYFRSFHVFQSDVALR